MWALVFVGEDGEFSYTYSVDFSYPEEAFRTPRLFGLTWTFDGDTWLSKYTLFPEANKWGRWTITNTQNLHPSLMP